MKLSKILAILMAVLVSPVISFASEDSPSSEREYVKLIEEGKTWEYIHRYMLYDKYSLTSFQMHFDGTETRNGIEYNKLVYCGDLTTWDEIFSYFDPIIPYNISTRQNDITASFLMREEEGKVYLYIKDLIDGGLNSEDREYISDIVEGIGDEAIIYDFTKNVGESIEMVFCNWDEQHRLYPFEPACWCCSNMDVNSVSELDLNGKKSIQQFCEYDEYILYSCGEGVGIISNGFLPLIDCHVPTPNFEDSHYYLNCLYDADGEIIYKANGEDFKYIDVAEVVRLADVEQPVIAPSIVRNSDGIKAENADITLFDLSGRMVVSGYETVSTTLLQPGVYIAKAESPSGISTLKIRID